MSIRADRPRQPEAELPPCPSCGTGQPSSAASDLRWVVACVGCPSKIVSDTRAAAEDAWRLRANPGDPDRR